MDKIFGLLGKFPAPYYVGHAYVALLIFICVFASSSDALAGALAGAFFYVGREVRDREKIGYWDIKGIVSPIAAMCIVYFSTMLN